MWVQIPQEEAEHGEFGDGVVQALTVCQCVDYPGCPPPPPVLLREGTGRPLKRRGRSFQAFDTHPLPKPRTAPTLGVHELQYPFQVSHQQHQGRGRQAKANGSFPASPGQPHQVVHQPEGAHGNQCGHQRDRQVVAHAGRHGGQASQKSHGEMAEVVVANRMSRQPGVFRWKILALQHGVQEGEVHGFFGVVYGGYLGYYARPQQEKS